MSDFREFALPAVLMRGGTSKGVFVRESDVPADRDERNRFVLALMGTPDPMQLDGLGGTHSSTSKVMLVKPSAHQGCDVDYTFIQVGIDREIVDYAGNCGNLTAAVGAYAIDEGLVDAVEPITTVRLFNTNTCRRVLAHVPVACGRAATNGDAVIAGVPGSGAALVTEYLDPGGSVTGAVLPTGQAMDVLHPAVGAPVQVSIVDVTTPVIFARAADACLQPHERPAAINARPDTLARLESIRAAGAVRIGLARNESEATERSAAVPRVLLTEAPQDHDLDGSTLAAEDHDLAVRAMSLQKAHHSCPLTSAMCAAAASRLPGTLPHTLAGVGAGRTVRVAHPKGVIAVDVKVDGSDGIMSVAVTRTARRLMSGTAYVSIR